MPLVVLGLFLARHSLRAIQKEEKILRRLTSHGCISTGFCFVLLHAGTSWFGSSVREAYRRNLIIHTKELLAEEDIATEE
jgi:hypothetical protein